MVSLAALWLPILVAAILVFVVSSFLHMALKYHRTDYGQVRSEDRVMEALRPFAIPPGDYMVPCPGMGSPQAPEFLAKMKQGTVMFMTVLPFGEVAMGRQPGGMVSLLRHRRPLCRLSQQSRVAGGRAVPRGLSLRGNRRVCRIRAGALAAHYNWYKRWWITTLKSNSDGLVYALLTGGVFGWLWP